MLEWLPDMPPGVMGFRGAGLVSRDEYRRTLIPPLREALDDGGPIRLLFQLGPGFEGYESGPLVEHARADLGFSLERRQAWERIALVTDVDRARRAIEMFGWMAPGEARAFRLEAFETAVEWVTG